MKSFAPLLVIFLLLTGCTNFPAGGKSSDRKPAVVNQEPNETFGNWHVNCVYAESHLSTQCKAEIFGEVTGQHGDGKHHPTPVLWVSWLKGEPAQARSICVFGHDYPVTAVDLQIDDNRPIQISALNAAGCILADRFLLKELREGRKLSVTFQRWPWGQTQATFSLDKSNNSLNELDRLVAGQ